MISSDPSSLIGEPDAHVKMRRAKTIVRWLLILALVSTIVLMLFFRPAAYLAAIPIPILLMILMLVSALERQSRATALRRPGQAAIDQAEIGEDVQDARIYTALGLTALLALGSFIIAAAIFEWPLVGISAAVLFLLAVLIELPYLYLFTDEAAREELEKVTHQSPSSED